MKPICISLLTVGLTFSVLAVDLSTVTKLTIRGETYEDVTWGRVTPADVTIFHKSGVATIPLRDLPEDLQKQFGYDSQKAGEHRATESARVAAALKQRREEEAKRERTWAKAYESASPASESDRPYALHATQNIETSFGSNPHLYGSADWESWEQKNHPEQWQKHLEEQENHRAEVDQQALIARAQLEAQVAQAAENTANVQQQPQFVPADFFGDSTISLRRKTRKNWNDGASGTYLGKLSANQFAADSISNPFGGGNPFNPNSVKSSFGKYGNPFSPYSVNNPYALDAPKLYDSHGDYRGRLSSNPYDPDSVSNPYGRYGNPYSADSIKNPFGAGNPFRSDSPRNPYGSGWTIIGDN